MTETKFKQTEIGIIPEDWEVKKIGDFGKVFTGKTPPSKNPEYFGEGIPFVTPTDFSNYNKHIYSASRSVSKEGQNRFKNLILKEDSIIVTCIGSDMGKVALNKVECITNQQINSITNINNAKPNFVYYKLKSSYSLLKSMATSGSTMPIVNKSDFQNILLGVPKSLDEQSAIAKILSDLDSKIELLQKQNETLEKIGQAIFKQWFVDFEFPNQKGKPYRSSGGEMIESELGDIPKGWSVGKLGDFVDSVSGCSYTSKGLEESKKALVTLKSISVNGFTQDGFKEYTGDYKDKHVVKDGDIVVAHTDLTQNRIILGKPAVVRDLGRYEVMIASMDLSVVRPIKLLNRPYLFYLLSTNMFYGHSQGYANGTTVIHLSRKAIPEFPFIIPSEKVLNHFKEFSNHLFDKISINQKGIISLEKTRDLLLPKLMSGKIRIPLEVEE
jgi:type I restriction enzyme, S subunit